MTVATVSPAIKRCGTEQPDEIGRERPSSTGQATCAT